LGNSSYNILKKLKNHKESAAILKHFECDNSFLFQPKYNKMPVLLEEIIAQSSYNSEIVDRLCEYVTFYYDNEKNIYELPLNYYKNEGGYFLNSELSNKVKNKLYEKCMAIFDFNPRKNITITQKELKDKINNNMLFIKEELIETYNTLQIDERKKKLIKEDDLDKLYHDTKIILKEIYDFYGFKFCHETNSKTTDDASVINISENIHFKYESEERINVSNLFCPTVVENKSEYIKYSYTLHQRKQDVLNEILKKQVNKEPIDDISEYAKVSDILKILVNHNLSEKEKQNNCKKYGFASMKELDKKYKNVVESCITYINDEYARIPAKDLVTKVLSKMPAESHDEKECYHYLIKTFKEKQVDSIIYLYKIKYI
jgi:hypothetical protein